MSFELKDDHREIRRYLSRESLQDRGIALHPKEKLIQVDERYVKVERKIIAVMQLFLENQGRLITPAELSCQFYKCKQTPITVGNARVLVHKARVALGPYASSLKTIPCAGYCFDARAPEPVSRTFPIALPTANGSLDAIVLDGLRVLPGLHAVEYSSERHEIPNIQFKILMELLRHGGEPVESTRLYLSATGITPPDGMTPQERYQLYTPSMRVQVCHLRKALGPYGKLIALERKAILHEGIDGQYRLALADADGKRSDSRAPIRKQLRRVAVG